MKRFFNFLDGMFYAVFGCPHKHMTRPFTLILPTGKRWTYCVCLDCTRLREYDLKTMRYV